MKTLIIFDSVGQDELRYVIVDGDRSQLQGVYVNQCVPEGTDEEEWEKLTHEVFLINCDEEGNSNGDMTSEFPMAQLKKLWEQGEEVKTATCGFLP